MFGLHSLVYEKSEQTRPENIPFGVIFVCLEYNYLKKRCRVEKFRDDDS